MGTTTKTFTEENSSRTWTFKFEYSDIVANSSIFTFTTPTLTAKFTGGSTTTAIYTQTQVDIYALKFGTVTIPAQDYVEDEDEDGGWVWADVSDTQIENDTFVKRTNDTFFSVAKRSNGTFYNYDPVTHSPRISTSRIFNSNNYQSKSVDVLAVNTDFHGDRNTKSNGNGNSYYVENNAANLKIGTVTLDAPPTYTPSFGGNTGNKYYKDYTTVSVDINNLSIKYGGSLKSISLTIGEQSTASNTLTTMYITLNALGTFTPIVTVTDSRDQVTTKTLDPITVEYKPPTFTSTQVTPNTLYSTISSAKVTISDLTAYNNATITSVTLKIGNQEASRSTNGDITINPVNSVGPFTPTVTAVDSNGSKTTISLNSVTVNSYSKPTASIGYAQRTNSSGVPLDEGTTAIIKVQFTHNHSAGTLVAPIVTVGSTETQTTWYTSRAADGTLSGSVTWNSLSSPVTLYGKLSGTYNYSTSYQINVTPRDSHTSGNIASATLPPAFYTIDFQAGGKEIAFGRPANDDITNYLNGLFHCGMDALFDENVDIASGKKYKINGVALSASDVSAVPTSRTVNSKALSSNVTLTASDVSAVALSDKYTRSSAGDIQWTNQTDGDAKVMAKSGVAFWNGAYNGSSSNLKYSVNGEILGKTIVKDYITENGSDGIWRYRKWSSGRIEAWCTKTWSNVACTTSMAGGYRSADQTLALPSGLFTTIESCQATMRASGGSGYTMVLRTISNNNTEISQMFWNSVSATKTSLTVDYYINGI